MSTLDADACAALLHCSKAHLHRLARGGELPATKVGKGWVFIHEDILAWLRTRSTPRPCPAPGRPGRPRKRSPDS